MTCGRESGPLNTAPMQEMALTDGMSIPVDLGWSLPNIPARTNPEKRVVAGVFGAIAKPAEPLWYSLDRCKTWHQGDKNKTLELVPNHSTGNDADREIVLWTAFTRGWIN